MHSVHRRISFFLLFSLAAHAFIHPQNLVMERPVARQLLPPASSTTSVASTSRSTRTTTAASSVSSTRSDDASASSQPSGSLSTTTSSSLSNDPSETQRSVFTSANLSTDPEGRVSTSILTVTPSAPSRTASQTSNSSNNASSGLGMGSIIGLSVAGGVALIIVVGFLVWKLTRKRFSDFDDNEAIKWPELNTHGNDSHALPVHNTGRAGFDTGSEVSFSRAPSTDPYAVPPLPHLNPNQPYRDDPAVVAPYYDPYRGPGANTFNDTDSMDAPPGPGWSNAEAIPMTQMTRSRSPGPQMGYDMGMAGRRSPGPQLAYGQQPVYVDERVMPAGRRSPGPQVAYEVPDNNMPR